MKYFARALVVLLALALLLPLSALAGSGDEAVIFTDKQLEDRVRGVLGIKEGDITLQMAEALTSLDIGNNSQEGGEIPEEYKIKSIEDLKYFKNLELLNLNNHAIHDISPLAGLAKLSALFLERNDIYDFSPLAGLVEMRDLVIDGNGKDLSFLRGLTNLSGLSLGGGNSELPQELKNLKNLTFFSSRWGGIRDISMLAGLKRLDCLDLSGNMISDITPLSGLPLTRLFLSDNLILDLSPIKDIYPNLIEKDFELILPDEKWGARPADALIFNDAALENKVRAAMSIPEGYILKAQAEGVTALDLSNPFNTEILEADKIASISALMQFPNLTFLNLDNNAFHEVKALASLANLAELSIRGTDIWEYTPLANNTKLHRLTIDCWGKDLGFLSSLTELVYLDLGGRPDLPAVLGPLPKLKTLLCAGGQLVDISGLAGLTSLESLNLAWNMVEDLTPIRNLPLKELYLAGNPIKDFSPIREIYPNLADKDFIAFPESVPEEPLVFADPKFETALRQAMNIYDRPITKRDAYITTKLDIYRDKTPDAGFSDISPLTWFVNLQELGFNASNISDLTPLSGLTGLTHLSLSYQQITDLGPLSGLKKLEGLNVKGNRISDLTPIAGLTKLAWLDVAQNQITDVSPLQNLVLLRSLFLSENPLGDWSPLDDLLPRLEETDAVMVPADVPDEPLAIGDPAFERALRTAMNIQGRPITKRDAWRVKELFLYGGDNRENAFTDISPLSAFVNLQKLGIDRTDVTDLTPLTGLQGLMELAVKYGVLQDLTPLSGMWWLTTLELNDNQIADVTPLAGLKGLKLLNLSGNRINDVAPLQGLGTLGILYLGNNPVKDFTPLKGLLPQLKEKDFEVMDAGAASDEPLQVADKNLKKALAKAMGITDRAITQKDAFYVTDLNIRESGIKDIGPLAFFVNLENLQADWNKITDLSPLAGLSKLRGLNLRGNQIKDLTPIAGLAQLNYLDAADNQIKDPSPLLKLPGLTALYMENNPIDDIGVLAGIEPNLKDKDFFAAVPENIPDEAIAFSDKNFEKAVRKLLNIPQNPVTQRDAWRVTRLDFANAKIRTAFKDVSPLKYFVNLQYLSMSGNGISDLSVIGGLQGLKMLILDSQKITDITPLSNLAHLDRLILNKNQITDLSPLAGMKGLYALELNNNKIADLTPLSGLEGLGELVIQGNQVVDTAPLGKLQKLWKLDLRKNKLTDAGPLSGLISLRELYLAGNKIKDYSPLKEMYSQLEKMDFKVK